MSDERHEPGNEPVDPTSPLKPVSPPAGDPPVSPAAQEDASPTAGRAPAWSGRAGVPPPRPASADAAGEWGGGDYYQQNERPWWMPILVGVVALLLIGVLIFGVWLIIQSAGNDGGPTVPSPSATASPTARPTSAAPTTASPTPAATTPASVPMPPLVGLSRQEATGLLDQLGIDYQVRLRPSDEPAGTVIETNPEAGEPVDEGERVTLVIAEPADPEPNTPTPSADPDD
nr:PASTA domain-containing protein [Micromonospora sp. DSM 115978]